MNKLTSIIATIMIVLLIGGGCTPVHMKENNLRQYRTIRGNLVSYTTPIFTQSINSDVYKLDYSDSAYQTIYYLSPVAGFNDKVVYNQKDTQQLLLADKKTYRIGEENFSVYKFIENKGVTDGEISLFWSPAYGIILEKVNTWKNIKKLIRTGRKEQDDTIDILCDVIFSDLDFYKNEVPDSVIKFVPPEVEKDQ